MKLFTRDYKMDDKENQIFSIVVKMANHQDTLILMDPLRDVYYMDNKRMNYFVMVSTDIIKITNHKFYYTNQISFKFSETLIKKIKLAISKDRQRVEREMFRNELNLLTDIDSKMATNRPRHEEIIEPQTPSNDKISDMVGGLFTT
jgi:hypothetical protein